MIETRQILQILVMFLIVQFFGLLLASMLFSGATYQQVMSAQVVSSATGVLFYAIYIVVVAAALMLILKVYKGDKLFILIEGGVVFLASFFVFLIISGEITSSTLFTVFGAGITTNFIIGVAAALALVVAKNRWQYLRNSVAIIASIGVGVVLGISFGFAVSLLFMAIIAVYDFIAVFITKHMVTMAKAMSSRNLAFLIGVNEIEAIPKSEFTSSQVKEFEKEAKGQLKGTAKRLYMQGMLPIAARVELGTGDLAIPLMVAVSAYSLNLNFTLSFFVIGGAVFGLILTTFILRRYKRALPAIPPLLFGVFVGVIAYMLVFGLRI